MNGLMTSWSSLVAVAAVVNIELCYNRTLNQRIQFSTVRTTVVLFIFAACRQVEAFVPVCRLEEKQREVSDKCQRLRIVFQK